MATIQAGPEDAETADSPDTTPADVVNSINLPLVLVGPDLSVVSFNRAAATLLSLLQSDIGRPIGSLPELAGVRHLEERCEVVIAGGSSPSQMEFRNTDGAYFSLAIGAYRSPALEIAGAILTFTNVTALHASLEQAIAEREYVKAIVNTMIEPLVVLDESLRIQTANQAFYTLFTVSRKPDLCLANVFDPEGDTWATSPVRTFLTDAGSDAGTETLEVVHTIPSLGERTLLLKARRISHRHVGRVTVLAVQDVTDQRTAELVIQNTMAVKDQFLSLVSHELRTPIATIFGNGLLLLTRDDVLAEEDKKQALADIVDESRRLQRIIENLLVLTRIDAGRELQAEPINLARLVEDAVTQFEGRSGRNIRLSVDGDVPVALGEAELILEVVTNLISNAQKYSRPDTLIEVVVSSTPASQPKVSVLDRGIGFTSDDAAGLFSAFYRSEAAIKVASGMGLGLAVSKKIVESCGGTIQGSRRDGGGSEFSFTLPRA